MIAMCLKLLGNCCFQLTVIKNYGMQTTIQDILVKSAQGAYGEDSHLIGKVFGLLSAVKFDQGTGPFICGALGKQGSDGLHSGYLICPMFGADVQATAIYMRKIDHEQNFSVLGEALDPRRTFEIAGTETGYS